MRNRRLAAETLVRALDRVVVLKEIAEEHCNGRLVSILEGGYDLDGLAASVESHIRVLMHETTDRQEK